jgi:hypothetical protein
LSRPILFQLQRKKNDKINVYNEGRRRWNDAVVAYFSIPFGDSPEETEKHQENQTRQPEAQVKLQEAGPSCLPSLS